MSDREPRLAPIDQGQLADADHQLRDLRRLEGDWLIVLSRRNARPGNEVWSRPHGSDGEIVPSFIETIEMPSGPLKVWIPIEEHEWEGTVWFRYWEILADAGLAFSASAKEGRRMIMKELARVHGASANAPLIRIEGAILATREILREAKHLAPRGGPVVVAADQAPAPAARMTVDQRMILLLQSTAGEAGGWTAPRIAEAIDCTPESVRQTKTWKALRKQQKGARNDRRA